MTEAPEPDLRRYARVDEFSAALVDDVGRDVLLEITDGEVAAAAAAITGRVVGDIQHEWMPLRWEGEEEDNKVLMPCAAEDVEIWHVMTRATVHVPAA